jgi:aryl-alcohol dehydrogenase-like predicted oxidoreductase
LTGQYKSSTTFGPGDHRQFNREGAAFDKGETFSGVPYDVGLQAVERLKVLFPGTPLHLAALRFVLDTPGVTTVIPGASSPSQVDANLQVENMARLTPEQNRGVEQIYDDLIRRHVHARW